LAARIASRTWSRITVSSRCWSWFASMTAPSSSPAERSSMVIGSAEKRFPPMCRSGSIRTGWWSTTSSSP
jgi:hypothetical protein